MLDLMPFLQGPDEVVLDLERGAQAVGEGRECGVCQDVLTGLRGGALFEQPGDVGTLLPFDTELVASFKPSKTPAH